MVTELFDEINGYLDSGDKPAAARRLSEEMDGEDIFDYEMGMYLAVRSGDFDVIRKCSVNGARYDHWDMAAEYAFTACEQGDIDMLRAITDNGNIFAAAQSMYPFFYITFPAAYGILRKASYRRKINGLQLLSGCMEKMTGLAPHKFLKFIAERACESAAEKGLPLTPPGFAEQLFLTAAQRIGETGMYGVSKEDCEVFLPQVRFLAETIAAAGISPEVIRMNYCGAHYTKSRLLITNAFFEAAQPLRPYRLKLSTSDLIYSEPSYIKGFLKLCEERPLCVIDDENYGGDSIMEAVKHCCGKVDFEYTRDIENSFFYKHMLKQKKGLVKVLAESGLIKDADSFVSICVTKKLYRLLDEYMEYTRQ